VLAAPISLALTSKSALSAWISNVSPETTVPVKKTGWRRPLSLCVAAARL
jgi:hypothetical protein